MTLRILLPLLLGTTLHLSSPGSYTDCHVIHNVGTNYTVDQCRWYDGIMRSGFEKGK